MNSHATEKFWQCFGRLPAEIRALATKQFRLWIREPRHPSIQFKKVAAYWSARITDNYRAVGVMDEDTVIWFWIGTHDEYERLLNRK
jgi:hypothetical protein